MVSSFYWLIPTLKLQIVTKERETSNSFEHKNRIQNVLDKLEK